MSSSASAAAAASTAQGSSSSAAAAGNNSTSGVGLAAPLLASPGRAAAAAATAAASGSSGSSGSSSSCLDALISKHSFPEDLDRGLASVRKEEHEKRVSWKGTNDGSFDGAFDGRSYLDDLIPRYQFYVLKPSAGLLNDG